MERLNDIMNHTPLTTTRRQQLHNREQTQPTQEQRLQQGGLRHTLPEQMARHGSQTAYGNQGSQANQASRTPQPSQPRSALNSTLRAVYPQGELTERSERGDRAGAYQQRPRPVHDTTARAQHTAQPIQAAQSTQAQAARPRPASPYFYSDDYAHPHALQSDALEDYEYDEDDTAGMRYGDWENGDNSDRIPAAKRAPGDIMPPGSPVSPVPPLSYTTHEPPGVVPAGRSHSSYVTRDLRDTRLPQAVPYAHPAQPVQPVQPEQRRYARHTQPLDPQVVANMSNDKNRERGREGREGKERREMMPEPVRSTQLAPHGAQQVVVHEHMLHYTTIAVPPPMPARSICPLCKGAGYLRVDVPFGHPNFGKPVACECKEAERKEKRRKELLELSELSAFHNTSFKNFNMRFPGIHPTVLEAYQEAYHFAHNPNGWLVLIGPNGCGKTHLAAAIANQCLSDGAVVLFTIVPDLLAHLRSTFSPNATEAYDQRFAKMREAELLVLDDLGAHQGSPWANEKLFQLLNYRYNLCYPTVITANRHGWESIDERIQSRLSDTGLVTRIVMNGALDYRRQNPRRDLLR